MTHAEHTPANVDLHHPTGLQLRDAGNVRFASPAPYRWGHDDATTAGFSYARVSDHHESAGWFREGIDVAVRHR